MELFRLLEESKFEDVVWLRSIDRHAEIDTFLPADHNDAPEIGVLYVGPLEHLPSPDSVSVICAPTPCRMTVSCPPGRGSIWFGPPVPLTM